MGPDCRRKHGYNIEASEDVRKQANKLVYNIALIQSAATPNFDGIFAATATLQLLGFDKLAGVIIERTAQIVIKVDGDKLVVQTPYRESATAGWRGVPGRRWDRDAKVNRVPVSSKSALWTFLRSNFAGCAAIGPRGPFTVEAA